MLAMLRRKKKYKFSLRLDTRYPPEALFPSELVALLEGLRQLLVQGFGQRQRQRGVEQRQGAEHDQRQGWMRVGLGIKSRFLV